MTTDTHIVAMPAYAPERFVGRAEESEFVLDIVRRMSTGTERNGHARTVVFTGQRGSGKTWLSLHLTQHVLPTVPGVLPLLVSLFPQPVGYAVHANEWFGNGYLEHTSSEHTIHELMVWVARHTHATTAHDVPLRTLTGWLVRDMEQLARRNVLALVLDSAFEADCATLQMLERYLLAPLAMLPNVVLILTGRGQPYAWESPYLRMGTMARTLPPFDVQDTYRQLARQFPSASSHAQEIWNLGGGAPLCNALLAQTPEPRSGLDDTADLLLSVVPAQVTEALHTALLPVSDTVLRTPAQTLRACFEALSVLDGFRDQEIPVMLGAHFGQLDQYRTLSHQQISDIRERLADTRLIHWQNGKFIQDPTLRVILSNYLREHQRQQWLTLHCHALHLYRQWVRQSNRWRDYYARQADQHALVLREHGYDALDCVPPTD